MKKINLLIVSLLTTIIVTAQNESKLVLDAGAGQTNTNPLIRLRNSGGGDLMWIHSDSYTNTFIGYGTGIINNPSNVIDGIFNTFIGNSAGYFNTTGFENTALGSQALYSIGAGDENTAVGSRALYANTIGRFNTAIGNQALGTTSASEFNVALGYQAGAYHNYGFNNTFLGAQSGGNDNGLYNIVAIGQGTTVTAVSNAILGNSATAKNGGYQNWSNVSDGRFKRNIKADVVGLDFILRLQPVTYNLDVTSLSKALHENQDREWNDQMKKAIADKEKMLQTGFIAQEVEKAALACGYNFSGVEIPKNEMDFYSLRYAEFVVPLVKAVQELNEELKLQVKGLNSENEMLTQRLEKLEALIGVENQYTTIEPPFRLVN
ncbi:MAG: tail fiber domain-containing protein [Saprospiraceae bacterium]|nr:tail fiber domain-containing protein [Saprospiraceae bacterium]